MINITLFRCYCQIVLFLHQANSSTRHNTLNQMLKYHSFGVVLECYCCSISNFMFLSLSLFILPKIKLRPKASLNLMCLERRLRFTCLLSLLLQLFHAVVISVLIHVWFLLYFVQRDNATLIPSFHCLYNIFNSILTWVGGPVGRPLGSAEDLCNLVEQLSLCRALKAKKDRKRNALPSHGLALLLQCKAIIGP